MQSLPLSLLLITLKVFTSSASDINMLHRIERVNDENRIVGGTNVGSATMYPWFVQGGGCGGMLISPDVVLTAAHCTGAFKVGNSVRMNSLKYGSGGQTYKIKQLLKHPKYNSNTNSYDFLLVKIEKTSSITPIALNKNDLVPGGGQDVTVIGYGATNPGGSIYPKDLKHVTVKALTHEQCAKQHGSSQIVKDSMLCAGLVGKDSCFGDSGGPLITTSKPPTLVGIVSWGPSKCASAGKFGVYAKVSTSYDWIYESMCDLTDTNQCSGGGGGGGGGTPVTCTATCAASKTKCDKVCAGKIKSLRAACYNTCADKKFSCDYACYPEKCQSCTDVVNKCISRNCGSTPKVTCKLDCSESLATKVNTCFTDCAKEPEAEPESEPEAEPEAEPEPSSF